VPWFLAVLLVVVGSSVHGVNTNDDDFLSTAIWHAVVLPSAMGQ
jgi:hypothetical protein